MIGLSIELALWLTSPRANSLTFLLYGVATLALLYTFRIIPTIELRTEHV